MIDDDDPAFAGLVGAFTKKNQENESDEDGGEDNDDEFDNSESATNPVESSFQEDIWISSIYEDSTDISIVSINICAHKIWVCSLATDSIRQGLLDFLDVVKPTELIYPDSISVDTKQRIEQRSVSAMDGPSSSLATNYLKLVKSLNKTDFEKHAEKFLGVQNGTEWYRSLPAVNQRSLHGFYVYLKEFGLLNLFVNPILVFSGQILQPPLSVQPQPGLTEEGSLRSSSFDFESSSSFSLDGITLRDLEIFDTLANTNAKLRKKWKNQVLEISALSAVNSSSGTNPLSSNKLKSLQNGLFGILDNCRTVYGKRTLKNWLMNPLTSRSQIIQRQDTIEWFLPSNTVRSSSVGNQSSLSTEMVAGKQKTIIFEVLHSCLEIEKLLSSLQYHRISFQRLINLLQFGMKLKTFASFPFIEDNNIVFPPLLKEWLQAVDWNYLSQSCGEFLSKLNHSSNPLFASSNGSNTDQSISGFFTSEEEKNYSILLQYQDKKSMVEQNLQSELMKIRKSLNKPNLNYLTFRSGTNSQIEYLIEIPLADTKKIPSNWIRVNSTKAVIRYHPPEVLANVDLLQKIKDEIKIYSMDLWKEFLMKVKDSVYYLFRLTIGSLSKFDVILSLSIVASYHQYCKPAFVENDLDQKPGQCIIEQGRHPILEKSLELLNLLEKNKRNSDLHNSSSVIANDVQLSYNFQGKYCQIITGPNMGGKSSYVRMIGLLIVLAQIGSFIPASSARLCIFENIFTRMGSEDDLSSGKSTFMCELIRTNKILQSIQPKSLVIIDELGRGTSTHDGQAIAQATLHYLISKIGCATLFITHFPQIAQLVDQQYADHAFNSHMSYLEVPSTELPVLPVSSSSGGDNTETDETEIVFLYKIVRVLQHSFCFF
jgi:DNA mismatch repair ATPase MutS